MSEIITATQPNVVVYARVARDEPGALEAQVSILRAVAASQGWTNPTVICEARVSGMSDAALRAVLGCDVLVIRDHNRLSGQARGMLELREAILASGVRIMTPDSIEGPGARGKSLGLIAELRALLVEAERTQHSERTRRGIAAAKARREAER